MYRVGLTGGIASGKSTVGELFREHGALLLDYDAIARYVVEPGMPALAEIVDRFGEQIAPEAVLDRQALGAIIFADDAARADLNAIVHPRVRAVAADVEQQVDDPYMIVVHMIPLLVESGRLQEFDKIVVVDVDPDIQLARLMARNGLSRDEALARIEAQASRVDRLRVADLVINNDGTLDDLAERTHAVWDMLHEFVDRDGVLPGCGC